jgi:hypothetical protein
MGKTAVCVFEADQAFGGLRSAEDVEGAKTAKGRRIQKMQADGDQHTEQKNPNHNRRTT